MSIEHLCQATREVPSIEEINVHVVQGYRNYADADKVWKQEVKRLKRELSEEECKQSNGVMWPFRKSALQLENEERELLQRVFEYLPKLEQVYSLREELTHISKEDYTKIEAKNAMKDWCERVRKSGIKGEHPSFADILFFQRQHEGFRRRSRCFCNFGVLPIKEFDSFLGTIETWRDKITNYLLERLTSGFVEGLNNRVKVLKRRSYGILNVEHIFQRLNLDINGYERIEFI